MKFGEGPINTVPTWLYKSDLDLENICVLLFLRNDSMKSGQDQIKTALQAVYKDFRPFP